jgi:hypothetical protein
MSYPVNGPDSGQRVGDLQIQCCAESLPMPIGEALEIPGAAAAAKDAQDRNQKQQSLGIAHPNPLRPSCTDCRKAIRSAIAASMPRDKCNPHTIGTSMTAPADFCLIFSRPLGRTYKITRGSTLQQVGFPGLH